MLMNKLNNCLYSTEHNDIDHIIAKFIKKNIETISEMTIDELAQSCFVSKTKISKFCRELGYDNFIAFKDECISETNKMKLTVENQKENLAESYNNHLLKSISVLKDNLMNVDQQLIEEIVVELKQAKQVYLYGIAYSHLLCQYMQYESDLLKNEVIVLDENLNKDYEMDQNSILIVLSVDGNVINDNSRIMRQLKQFPVNKILITTTIIEKEITRNFNQVLAIPSKGSDIKDRQLLLRYIIDVIMGRYQYLYTWCALAHHFVFVNILHKISTMGIFAYL